MIQAERKRKEAAEKQIFEISPHRQHQVCITTDHLRMECTMVHWHAYEVAHRQSRYLLFPFSYLLLFFFVLLVLNSRKGQLNASHASYVKLMMTRNIFFYYATEVPSKEVK